MKAEGFLRKTHRAIATLFLFSTVLAAIVSARGNAESLWIYGPLPFLFVLIITGTYLLVQPWVVRLRVGRKRKEVTA